MFNPGVYWGLFSCNTFLEAVSMSLSMRGWFWQYLFNDHNLPRAMQFKDSDLGKLWDRSVTVLVSLVARIFSAISTTFSWRALVRGTVGLVIE